MFFSPPIHIRGASGYGSVNQAIFPRETGRICMGGGTVEYFSKRHVHPKRALQTHSRTHRNPSNIRGGGVPIYIFEVSPGGIPLPQSHFSPMSIAYFRPGFHGGDPAMNAACKKGETGPPLPPCYPPWISDPWCQVT